MKTHELKIWPQYFKAVANGTKTFEVRENDRNFQFGDTVVLREWNPARPVEICKDTGAVKHLEPYGYSGRYLSFKIGFIYAFNGNSNLCVFSLLRIES